MSDITIQVNEYCTYHCTQAAMDWYVRRSGMPEEQIIDRIREVGLCALLRELAEKEAGDDA